MAKSANASPSSIARLIAKRDELVARQKQIESHLGHLERKARTRRLIQQGALAEKYLGVEDLSQMEALLQRLAELRYSSGELVIDVLRGEALEDIATAEVLREVRPERD